MVKMLIEYEEWSNCRRDAALLIRQAFRALSAEVCKVQQLGQNLSGMDDGSIPL
jgi:hypothetical protein